MMPGRLKHNQFGLTMPSFGYRVGEITSALLKLTQVARRLTKCGQLSRNLRALSQNSIFGSTLPGRVPDA